VYVLFAIQSEKGHCPPAVAEGVRRLFAKILILSLSHSVTSVVIVDHVPTFGIRAINHLQSVV
jgi:hypothetical protein